jgi:hypothetical protein
MGVQLPDRTQIGPAPEQSANPSELMFVTPRLRIGRSGAQSSNCY